MMQYIVQDLQLQQHCLMLQLESQWLHLLLGKLHLLLLLLLGCARLDPKLDWELMVHAESRFQQ